MTPAAGVEKPSDEAALSGFEVVAEEGVPHGDLYQLEQMTWYRVVDRRSDRIVATFEGGMEASLSRESGLWEDHRFFGVRQVVLAPDGGAVHVKYFDGREELVPLLE